MAAQELKRPYPNLPFIVDGTPPGERRSPRNYWVTTPTGDYAQDCTRGSDMAVALIEHITTKEGADDLPILSHVIQGMIEAGQSTGEIVGFAWTFAEAFRTLLNVRPGFAAQHAAFEHQRRASALAADNIGTA